nr:RNA-directed DNA polymerase, eukaryota, reverse transcriptase zinc-binding domain protein [Tanacetum cinerariifolium]
MEGSDTFVESTWKSMNVDELNGLIRLNKKLQCLKNAVKVWARETRTRLLERKKNIKLKLSDVDKIIDQGKGNEEVVNSRSILLKELQDLSSLDATEIFQKAKVRWSIEGDENTNYFHEDLERIVSYDEVKRAVWDCGANKSPGPDGFTFEFFRKFWKIIDQDKCFYLASGLKINFHKSKLMGVGVNQDVVNRAASMVVCSRFTSPFKYLGVKVVANMSRISSWEDVVNKWSILAHRILWREDLIWYLA